MIFHYFNRRIGSFNSIINRKVDEDIGGEIHNSTHLYFALVNKVNYHDDHQNTIHFPESLKLIFKSMHLC